MTTPGHHSLHSGGTFLPTVWCCRCSVLADSAAELVGTVCLGRTRRDHVITCGTESDFKVWSISR